MIDSDLVGAVAVVALTVGEADLARALGSGDVAVLGTPRLVALCEQATVAAVHDLIPPGTTTVGTRVELDHLRPNRVGDLVEARATVTAVEGRRITFAVDVHHGDHTVGRGVVTRALVDRERFDQQG